ncbi:hypothetical protein E4U59_005684 [Claviceps monticola]|nr:hypothetical protein E4U59_005684 [Claviceps monticola]
MDEKDSPLDKELPVDDAHHNAIALCCFTRQSQANASDARQRLTILNRDEPLL